MGHTNDFVNHALWKYACILGENIVFLELIPSKLKAKGSFYGFNMPQSIADRIKICALVEASSIARDRQENIGGMVSAVNDPYDGAKGTLLYLSPKLRIPRHFVIVSDSAHHLPAFFPGIELKHPPHAGHITETFEFASKIGPDKNLLLHCTVGKYRSPALALAIIAHEYGPGKENEALQKVLAIRPRAAPSLPLVKIADDLLSRNGRLLAAVMNEPQVATLLAIAEQRWRGDVAVRAPELTLPPPVFVQTEKEGPARPNPLTYGRTLPPSARS